MTQKMETKMTTWLELSKASNGTHVCFPLGHDIFPDALVPEGAMGVIQENGLNEIWCTMLILPDDKNIREQLKEWDGCIVLQPSLGNNDEHWNSESPIKVMDQEQKT